MATTHISRRGGMWWYTRTMPLTVAANEWAEAVRQAIEDDLEQPDRRLLARLLDDALSLEGDATTAARLRQRASDLRASTAVLAAITTAGDRVRNVVANALPIVRATPVDWQSV